MEQILNSGECLLLLVFMVSITISDFMTTIKLIKMEKKLEQLKHEHPKSSNSTDCGDDYFDDGE